VSAGAALAGVSDTAPVDWRVRGSYFEGCNCDAICPCRSVRGAPGGASTHGECFGALSWRVTDGHADSIDLSGRLVVMTLRYFDRQQPSTRWEVVLYVDDGAGDAQVAALASIFLGRAGGTVAAQYGRAIGEVHAVRRARITVEHVAGRKRIDVAGYITLEAEQPASEVGEVACGIPGLDHPGQELHSEVGRSEDPALRWEIVGRGAAFASDFDYRS
jgi:hypothetical protein